MSRFLLLIMAAVIFTTSCLATNSEKHTLKGGWFPWDPYQYNETDATDGAKLTGLDIELVRKIASLAQRKITNTQVSWQQHQLDLRTGVRDVAAGAAYSPERAAYVHYSLPYRYEQNSLFVPRPKIKDFAFATTDEMLKYLIDNQIKLAVIEGYVYVDAKINQFLAEPRNQHLIMRTKSDIKSMYLLKDGKVGAFLADKLVGATIVWRARLGKEIGEINLSAKTPIHLIFSKASVSPAVVKQFNAAIGKLKETHEYNKLVSWYLYPVLLLQTISSDWFFILDILGTLSFAISGLIIAYKEKSTLFGAFIFAILPAIGGGLVRDVIVGRTPVSAMESPLYIGVVVAAVIVGYLFLKVKNILIKTKVIEQKKLDNFGVGKSFLNTLLVACDALGLAAFAVSGVVIAIWAKAEPLWLWGPFFAFLTGAGGSIIRDIMRKDREIVSLQDDLYAEFAAISGLCLSLFLTFNPGDLNPEPIKYAVIITVAGTFSLIMLAHIFKARNIMFR